MITKMDTWNAWHGEDGSSVYQTQTVFYFRIEPIK